MDYAPLKKKLTTGKLIIGDVKNTVQDPKLPSAPIGFMAFDLDYYSSTHDEFMIFKNNSFLPRVMLYFDDVIGRKHTYHCDSVGELLAIKEFNNQENHKKIAPINGFRWRRRIPAAWNDMTYVMHDFAHKKYSQYIWDKL